MSPLLLEPLPGECPTSELGAAHLNGGRRRAALVRDTTAVAPACMSASPTTTRCFARWRHGVRAIEDRAAGGVGSARSGVRGVGSVAVGQEASDRLGAIGHAERAQDVPDVPLDGALAEEQASSDLRVAEAFSHEAEDLELAGG